MQRIFKQESKEELVREACAVAWYRYPDDVNFKNNLLLLLNDPASLSWLEKAKLFQHMHNIHRCKLLKHYPQLFSNVDLFTLMISAFIPDSEIAELAMAQVPHLRTQAEYQQILSVIPAADLERFKVQAENILNPILYAETADLSFCQEVPNENASHPDKNISILHPITPNTALVTVSAALYYYTQNYYSVTVLWGLYSLYNLISTGLHATATQFEKFLPFKSLFAAPTQNIKDTTRPDANNNAAILKK